MNAGFGDGVSIPSQLRWIGYVDRWANQLNKAYKDRPVEIVEVHLSNLSVDMTVSVQGYVDAGRRIHVFHTFLEDEKLVMEDGSLPLENHQSGRNPSGPTNIQRVTILKPNRSTTEPVILPTSDINITLKGSITWKNWTIPNSRLWCWFNVFFEGGGGSGGGDENPHGQENGGAGVFEIDWHAMDGLKSISGGNSSRESGRTNGAKPFDRLKVLWRYS